MLPPVFVATAGWTLPRQDAERMPPGDSHLHRYAQVLPGTEVNASFHRTIQPKTWARWAATVPDSFRFAVKLPKTFSHTARLDVQPAEIEAFLRELEPLGDRCGPLLLQVPPSLAFDRERLLRFVAPLRGRTVVLEPRHASWFTPEVHSLLQDLQIARVAADPALVPEAAVPGGWPGLRYFRLHGWPVKYRSAYPQGFLDALAAQLRPGDWCVFDNTASGAALGNALDLHEKLRTR